MGDGNDFAWGLVVMLPIIANLAIGPRNAVSKVRGHCRNRSMHSRDHRDGVTRSDHRHHWRRFSSTGVSFSQRKAFGTVGWGCDIGNPWLQPRPLTTFERMSSVSRYQQDNSAQLRLQAWRAAIQMAVDHPTWRRSWELRICVWSLLHSPCRAETP